MRKKLAVLGALGMGLVLAGGIAIDYQQKKGGGATEKIIQERTAGGPLAGLGAAAGMFLGPKMFSSQLNQAKTVAAFAAFGSSTGDYLRTNLPISSVIMTAGLTGAAAGVLAILGKASAKVIGKTIKEFLDSTPQLSRKIEQSKFASIYKQARQTPFVGGLVSPQSLGRTALSLGVTEAHNMMFQGVLRSTRREEADRVNSANSSTQRVEEEIYSSNPIITMTGTIRDFIDTSKIQNHL